MLYVLMAVAAWLVWGQQGLDAWIPIGLFGLLLVPYLAWVTFAGNLNRVVWRMNPRAV